MDMADLPPTEPRLVHFKCEHDPTWDYTSISNTLFLPDQKILVVGEKWKSNPHVHFQGYTLDAPRTFANKLSELAKRHASRDPAHLNYRGPKTRPMSQGRGSVNVTGFQYMSKEPLSAHNPIYQKGFTQEELEELHAASNLHVEKVKFRVRDYLHEVLTDAHFQKADASDTPAKKLYAEALRLVAKKLREENKGTTMHTRRDIFNALILHPKCSDEMAAYLIDMAR